jgi:hypothetical protein
VNDPPEVSAIGMHILAPSWTRQIELESQSALVPQLFTQRGPEPKSKQSSDAQSACVEQLEPSGRPAGLSGS